MAISCTQSMPARLMCHYRLRAGGGLDSIIADLDGHQIEATPAVPYPRDGDTTAFMLLVDTSDPARQPVIDRIVEQIGAFVDLTRPHHRIGLASFDTDLYLIAGIGSSPSEIKRAAATLTAKGQTTELYRNLREAVRLITRDKSASRRALIVMSDGLAEDYAYHHADVVKLALEHDVVIHGIGYPRSVAQSVALQTIRRLADETGGQYAQADHLDFSLPQAVFPGLLAATDSGGTFEFDLSALLAAGLTGERDLSLAFQTAEQSFIVLAPIRLPSPADTAPAADSGNDSTPGSARIPAVRATTAAPPPERKLWPWFVTLGLLIMATLLIVLVAIRRMRHTLESRTDNEHTDTRTLAYFVMKDDTSTRHSIDKLPWRIGRGRNCDLILDDHSVSRLHAELRHNEEGQLILRDLESLNGVFVNDNRIDAIQLREGDSVDIGDVPMHFTLHDDSYADQAPTVLVRTHAP